MANILGSITLNEISICEIDQNPSISGLDLSIGSLVIDTNTGIIYTKTGNSIYDWSQTSFSTNLTPLDISLNFDGTISVLNNSLFKIPSQIGVRIKNFPTKQLDINGTLTVSSNGRFIIENNSNVTLRSL